MKAALSCAAFLFVLVGCATFGAVIDLPTARVLAAERGFSEGSIDAGGFRLAALLRQPTAASAMLTVYIEGDGAAWPSPYHPPRDPTPRKPVALALALADAASAVAYLGRPCQYLDETMLARCGGAYWVERRFSSEVVAAYEVALDQLKARYGARRLRLVGYSGGGVIAALLAARRKDVEALVTVAAPLALGEWAARHGASPLTGSLDPAEVGPMPAAVHALHFVGGRDTNVAAPIVEAYVRRQGGRLEVVPDFDHECCWARDWPRLLAHLALGG